MLAKSSYRDCRILNKADMLKEIWTVLTNPLLFGFFIFLLFPFIWAIWVWMNREKTAAEDAKKPWQYIQKHGKYPDSPKDSQPK